MLNNFQAALKLLDPKQSKIMTLREKMDLFFLDFGIMPLFVQENYLMAYGNTYEAQAMQSIASAADFISVGDLISIDVNQRQQWSLLPNLGLMSCVAPTTINKTGYCNYAPFPSIMGKMSTMRKIYRLIKEMKEFVGPQLYADKNAALTEYLPLLFQMIY